jgi:hypothetical protein
MKSFELFARVEKIIKNKEDNSWCTTSYYCTYFMYAHIIVLCAWPLLQSKTAFTYMCVCVCVCVWESIIVLSQIYVGISFPKHFSALLFYRSMTVDGPISLNICTDHPTTNQDPTKKGYFQYWCLWVSILEILSITSDNNTISHYCPR